MRGGGSDGGNKFRNSDHSQPIPNGFITASNQSLTSALPWPPLPVTELNIRNIELLKGGQGSRFVRGEMRARCFGLASIRVVAAISGAALRGFLICLPSI